MNTDLKNFVLPIARALSATLFFVLSVAFVSVPHSLEQDPSDAQQLTHPTAPRGRCACPRGGGAQGCRAWGGPAGADGSPPPRAVRGRDAGG